MTGSISLDLQCLGWTLSRLPLFSFHPKMDENYKSIKMSELFNEHLEKYRSRWGMFCSVWVVPGMEPRTSFLLRKWSTLSWILNPSILFKSQILHTIAWTYNIWFLGSLGRRGWGCSPAAEDQPGQHSKTLASLPKTKMLWLVCGELMNDKTFMVLPSINSWYSMLARQESYFPGCASICLH